MFFFISAYHIVICVNQKEYMGNFYLCTHIQTHKWHIFTLLFYIGYTRILRKMKITYNCFSGCNFFM